MRVNQLGDIQVSDHLSLPLLAVELALELDGSAFLLLLLLKGQLLSHDQAAVVKRVSLVVICDETVF